MHIDRQRFYTVLGIDPSASDEAVRMAFRRRAKELHPDAPTGDAAAFILLKRAYDTLTDPEQRADYDRACHPPPAAEKPHRWAAPPPLPPMPPRPMARRHRSGMGFTRYAIAFAFMAAIALGGVQVMISLTEAPPSIATRATTPALSTLVGSTPAASPAPAAEATLAPGSSKSGFWDPTPAPATTKK